MDRSEGEGGRPSAADTSPSRREAARCEQARRDSIKRLSIREQGNSAELRPIDITKI